MSVLTEFLLSTSNIFRIIFIAIGLLSFSTFLTFIIFSVKELKDYIIYKEEIKDGSVLRSKASWMISLISFSLSFLMVNVFFTYKKINDQYSIRNGLSKGEYFLYEKRISCKNEDNSKILLLKEDSKEFVASFVDPNRGDNESCLLLKIECKMDSSKKCFEAIVKNIDSITEAKLKNPEMLSVYIE